MEIDLSRMCEAAAGLALLLLCGVAAGAQEQVVGEPLDGSVGTLLSDPNVDVLVVTVVSVENGPFTNAHPPQGLVRVDEALRGGEAVGAVYPTQWRRPLQPGDYEDPGGVRDGVWVQPRIKPDWSQRPLVAPDPGDRMIVFAAGVAEAKSVRATAAFRFSPESRAFAVANMAPPERSPAFQGPAFLFLVLAPVVCVVLHFGSRSRAASGRVKARLRLALAFMFLFVPAVYAFYESGISIRSNIRVDLLLVWPAMALTLAIASISLLCKRRSGQA